MLDPDDPELNWFVNLPLEEQLERLDRAMDAFMAERQAKAPKA